MSLALSVSDVKPQAAAPPRWDTPLTLRDLITPVFVYLKPALIALLIPLILAFLVALMAKPTYVAQSRLLVLLGPEYVFRGDPSNANSSQSFDRAQIMHAETEILTSRSLREAALKSVGVGKVYRNAPPTPEGVEAAIRALDKDVVIENIPQSNIIDLSLRNRDPKVAAEMLNTFVRLYLERRRAIFQQADVAAVRAERATLAAELKDIETELAAFAEAHRYADFEQELAAVQAQKVALDSQLQALDQQLATSSGRAAFLHRRMTATPATVEVSADRTRSQELDALTTNLLTLQAQRREAAAKYADGFPLVADLDARIADLQRKIADTPGQQVSAVRNGINPVRQDLDTALADAQGNVAGLSLGRREAQAAREAVQARIAELMSIGPQVRDLSRRRSVLDGAVVDLDKRARDAELADQLTRSKANVRVVQTAEPPVKGTTGRLKILAAGGVLGLLAAACVIVFRTALAQSSVTPRDVEQKLSIPAVLCVAEASDAPLGRIGGLPRARFLRHDDAEILMRLLVSAAPSGARVMQLMGAVEGEGTTSLVMDLAILQAMRTSARIFILDVEPRAGESVVERFAALGAEFEEQASRSIHQIKGRELYISAPIDGENLSVADSAWMSVIARARSKYDIVLIDAPPVSRSSAAVTLAPLADLNLLVVEAEQTRAPASRNLISAIEGAGAEVTGAILNKRRFHIPGWLYRRI